MKKIDFKNYDKPVTEGYDIPSAGIEDIDRALVKLFNDDISFEVMSNNELVKIPVVFASGERFALTRRKDPIRDKNNTLILPIISVSRGKVDFSASQGGRGSAITTRDQSNYVIKKRLSETDRDYQNIINKFGIKNQDNVASRKNFMSQDISPGNRANPGTIASRRQSNGLKFSKSGGMISLTNKNVGNNIFEIIQIPYPTLVTVDYEVTFWTQYMTQMNEVQEAFLSSMLGQSEEFLIVSEKGYEYVAKSGTSFSSAFNFDNYTDSERIIKTSIDFKVSGYLLNVDVPGIPNQVRSFLSAPVIEFGYNNANKQIVKRSNGVDNKRDVDSFILSDVKPLENNNPDDLGVQTQIVNPFTGDKEVNFSKIITSDQRSGETVVSSLLIKKIETQYE
jgi:hypothetical protein